MVTTRIQQNWNYCVTAVMNQAITVAISLFFSATLHGQVTMGRFSAQRYQDQIVLSWDIKAGSFCNGIDIERSTDGIAFERVGDIAGICGDPDFDVSYQHVDEAPAANAVNYYRLLLGNQDYSDTVFVQFIQFDAEWKVFPTPAKSTSILALKSPPSGAYTVKFWDNHGRLVHQEMNAYGEQMSLAALSLQAGTYHFSIEQNNTRLLSGSFVWAD